MFKGATPHLCVPLFFGVKKLGFIRGKFGHCFRSTNLGKVVAGGVRLRAIMSMRVMRR